VIYNIRGYTAHNGLHGGAFSVDRPDRNSVFEYIVKELRVAPVTLVSIEERSLLKGKEPESVFTWTFESRDNGEEHSDFAYTTDMDALASLESALLEMCGGEAENRDIISDMIAQLNRNLNMTMIHSLLGGGRMGLYSHQLVTA